MARQRGLGQHFTPTKGVVTEFTPTRFPTDAAVDADNCVFDVDGSVRRRPGLNFEQTFSLNKVLGTAITATQKDTYATSTHLWKAVNNSGTLNIVVVQVGTYIQFYAQTGSVSSNLLGEIDLSPYAVNFNNATREQVQVTSGIGNLYVTSKYIKPVEISYTGATFNVSELEVKVRDFDGIDDGLAVDERPTLLTYEHCYNLLNQGWTYVGLTAFALKDDDGNFLDEIESFHDDENKLREWYMYQFYIAEPLIILGIPAGISSINSRGQWPSNVDQMQLGFTTDADGNPSYDADIIFDNTLPGNTPAPKGHFILDAFAKDRAAAMETPYGILLDKINIEQFVNRPASIAFHNGKLFMAQPAQSGTPSGIYYSQTLTTASKADKMHSEADPTAEDINDLVATDGGFISAPGLGEIYKLAEMSNGVFVGAGNGIWYLSGADVDSGFTATSNRLFKITDIGMMSASSYVEAVSGAYFWSSEGIIQVTIGDQGLPVAQNLTERTIQSFYINISAESRRLAKGVFVPEQRKVYWGYSSADARSTASKEIFDQVLILDLNIGGFYFYSLGTDTENDFPEVRGFTNVASLADVTTLEELTTSTGEIIYLVDGTTIVESESQDRTAQVTQLKALTLAYSSSESGWVVTFSEFNDRKFHDWRFVDTINGTGINYSSYIEFGYNTFGANHTRGMPTYVHSFFSTRSKNLDAGGYYELPPAAPDTDGFRCSQSVLETLHKGLDDLEVTVSQSVFETAHKSDAEIKFSQSVIEVLHTVV